MFFAFSRRLRRRRGRDLVPGVLERGRGVRERVAGGDDRHELVGADHSRLEDGRWLYYLLGLDVTFVAFGSFTYLFDFVIIVVSVLRDLCRPPRDHGPAQRHAGQVRAAAGDDRPLDFGRALRLVDGLLRRLHAADGPAECRHAARRLVQRPTPSRSSLSSPERLWMRFMFDRSRGALARGHFSDRPQHPSDQTLNVESFDPHSEFALKYRERREELRKAVRPAGRLGRSRWRRGR